MSVLFLRSVSAGTESRDSQIDRHKKQPWGGDNGQGQGQDMALPPVQFRETPEHPPVEEVDAHPGDGRPDGRPHQGQGVQKGLIVMAMAKSLTQPAVPSASSAQAPNRPAASHRAPMTSDRKPKSHTFHQHRPPGRVLQGLQGQEHHQAVDGQVASRVSRITGGLGQNIKIQMGKITL